MPKKYKPRKGKCPQCGKGPKVLDRRHPETGQPVCRTCYRKIKTNLEEREFLQSFQNLTEFQAAGWIVDTAYSREPKRIKQLNILIKLKPDKVKKLCQKIRGPASLIANQILEEFLKTKEGKKLKSLLAIGDLS